MKPTYEELEAKCAALAAENEGLKSNLMYWNSEDAEPARSPLDIAHESSFGEGVEFDVQVAARMPSMTYRVVRRTTYSTEIELVSGGIPETPATDAFLAEVRASAIPEGYVLVPQEMHLSSEAMEGICFHCGDGDHKFGEFTDGTLFVGEVDYGDGKKVHGLHIATADYPEEGCATICEFAAQLRKGVQS
ncbi:MULTISPECIES: hypothetical protein [Enterobacter cloacae complex]|uniref:Uncharacterized protein n=1 Tax=Enterobacter kobei TaxID=208224 RepID=A0A2J0PCB8_9ENTR|nr:MULTISPECIES: hypothetical protein [Enterobacter cloacae complex]ELE6495585.1 hypothetical protein [Enterobacter kobei]MBW7594422.1 hypothetical protein [Enterobacter hormaechei]MBW7612803.1 hypothetical protein [Enterobacter hormaechei]MBW7628711.1 hypothetical protein [Enterobacter hormaechei]MBW7719093.1 hypothetical protein [Enterobacter kobei]